MRLGCCASIDDAAKLKAAGFEFLEVGVQNVLKGQEDDATWSANAPKVEALPLPIEAANGLVPASLPIVGPQRDLAALKQYMHRVCDRAGKIGIRRLVFGSGGARRRPDGVDDATAFDHIVDFCRIAGDAAAPRGVTIVIEHLNRGETNTINSLAQELELMDRVDHPAVMALVDSYHYGKESETDNALLALGHRLKHVHVAEVVNRCQPGGNGPFGTTPDAFDFETFFALLRKIGYRERVSFEGKWTKPVEEIGPATVELLKSAWQNAGRVEV